jgi:hypothetical protein
MKKRALFCIIAIAFAATANAQETLNSFNVSADLVSRYLWRGQQLSNAPAFQPTLSYTTEGLTLSAWGSYAFNNGGTECDLSATYAFPFGVSIYLTDYYFPSDPAASGYSEYFKSRGGFNHTVELGAGYAYKGFSLSGYYYLNYKNDVYLEASYTYKNLSLFAGAGNENYTVSSNFNVVNVGLKVFKVVSISDKYSIKPFATFAINPNKEQVFLVAGLTFF